jgi:thiosulfate dehydrogenase [quinone] large subunit
MLHSMAPDRFLVPGLSVGLFRMGFGLLYLHMAFQKAPWVVSEGHRFGWLHGWIEKEIEHPTFGLYQAFLERIVLPNFTLFGFLSFLTEVALGLSLLLGLFTVLGGFGGALWMLNIALGSFSVPGEWPWVWFLQIAPQVVFAHTRAGRVLGLDQVLHRRIESLPAEQRGRAQHLLKVA